MSDNTIKVEGLGELFKQLGENRLNVSKKMAENVLKNPRRDLEIGGNVGIASRSTKAALSSLPEEIKFFHTGKGFYRGKFL